MLKYLSILVLFVIAQGIPQEEVELSIPDMAKVLLNMVRTDPKGALQLVKMFRTTIIKTVKDYINKEPKLEMLLPMVEDILSGDYIYVDRLFTILHDNSGMVDAIMNYEQKTEKDAIMFAATICKVAAMRELINDGINNYPVIWDFVVSMTPQAKPLVDWFKGHMTIIKELLELMGLAENKNNFKTKMNEIIQKYADLPLEIRQGLEHVLSIL